MTDLIPGGSIIELGLQIIKQIIPDPVQQAKAQLDLINAEREGKLSEAKVNLSAILAEAQSGDKWTSRARPSFLYVVYILLLAGLPMGVLYAVSPETAASISTGFNAWLKSIPDRVYDLFQWVMLGYITSRGIEKVRGAAR